MELGEVTLVPFKCARLQASRARHHFLIVVIVLTRVVVFSVVAMVTGEVVITVAIVTVDTCQCFVRVFVLLREF